MGQQSQGEPTLGYISVHSWGTDVDMFFFFACVLPPLLTLLIMHVSVLLMSCVKGWLAIRGFRHNNSTHLLIHLDECIEQLKTDVDCENAGMSHLIDPLEDEIKPSLTF